MRVLGIDPGIATIGFGLVDSDKNSHKLINCGVITTPAHTSLSSRLDLPPLPMTAVMPGSMPSASQNLIRSPRYSLLRPTIPPISTGVKR